MDIRSFYPEARFGGFTDIDGTIAFYSRVRALLSAEFIALDIGCGRGAVAEDPVSFRREIATLRGHCQRVIGIDVDPVGAMNPNVDEFRLIRDGRWPVEDASMDLAVADWVLEHLDDPPAFFAEAARVIKPGGYFCARTPNAWSYGAVASRLIPNHLHARILAWTKATRTEQDVFPTHYRCNTRGALSRFLRESGFADHVVYGYDPEPGYLAFSRITYALGMLHQRLAPRAIRANLFVFARRDP